MEMNNKWPYKILLESQNLDFKGHDLNVIPYPFKENSFDIVNSWGAIEFYGRPKYWNVFILEMLRISKEYVNISFNDISPWLKENKEYIQEYNTFFNEIETQFSDYNIVIEKVTDRHYKFLKQENIKISYLDLSNINKIDPYLKDINTIYNTNYVSCKYIEKEYFIRIKNTNELPDNSGISFTFHKNLTTATLIFLAKKITENECYIKVYTGKKWIKFDEPLELEYKKFSIVSEFDFNAKSKWRIGFKINTDQNIDYELCLKNIEFK